MFLIKEPTPALQFRSPTSIRQSTDVIIFHHTDENWDLSTNPVQRIRAAFRELNLRGIIHGFSDGRVGFNEPITTERVAQIIWNIVKAGERSDD